MLYLGQKSKTPSENYRLENKSHGFVKRRHYTEVVYIIGDTLADDVDTVRADANLPKLYEERDSCYCMGISPKEAATVVNPNTGVVCSLWEITLEWDSDIGTDSSAGGSEGATLDNRPPQYRWVSEQDDEVVYTDINGKLVATPTGEPIVIVRPTLLPVLEIKRNERFPFEPTVMMNYANHKNSGTFWGAPQGTALMLPMETDYPITEDGYVYVPITYRIKFKIEPSILTPGTFIADTWHERPVNKGLYYYDSVEYAAWVAGGFIAASKPIPKPYANARTGWNIKETLLSTTGEVLPQGGVPIHLNFETYPDANFDDLSLQPWWWMTTTTTTT